jgi:GTPase
LIFLIKRNIIQLTYVCNSGGFFQIEDNRKESLAILVGVDLNSSNAIVYDLDELRFLCETLDLKTYDKVIQKRDHYDPKYYIGEGKLEEIKQKCIESDAQYIVFDDELTPSQLRNLEKKLTRQIIDRSELILQIFEKRARTGTAKLQIELAKLKYSLPRLKRMWTHFSRIEGGISSGGGGGPGEKQIELDRRMVRDRIHHLTKKIENQTSRRKETVQKRMDEYKVSLVGYTNAGKTTLLNRIANTELFAENKLFATLDTTTRRVALNGRKKILISDTIGFISKIPHHLIASFYSTMEEIKQADLLIHVADISHPQCWEQIKTVENELKLLSVEEKPTILLLNKWDVVEDKDQVIYTEKNYTTELKVSALTGSGIDELVKTIENIVMKDYVLCQMQVNASDGKLISYLKANSDVKNIHVDQTTIYISMLLDRKIYGKLKKHYPDLITIVKES